MTDTVLHIMFSSFVSICLSALQNDAKDSVQ